MQPQNFLWDLWICKLVMQDAATDVAVITTGKLSMLIVTLFSFFFFFALNKHN